jgi:hypothetical protein
MDLDALNLPLTAVIVGPATSESCATSLQGSLYLRL